MEGRTKDLHPGDNLIPRGQTSPLGEKLRTSVTQNANFSPITLTVRVIGPDIHNIVYRMGTFMGHVVPGTFFLLFSTWDRFFKTQFWLKLKFWIQI
jgi:hypothetical protein